MKIIYPLLMLILLVPLFAASQDGTLDPAFNTTGYSTSSIGSGDDNGNAVALQSDGKIVVAGESGSGADFSIAVIRYSADGTIDNSFGTNGQVTTNFGHFYDTGKSVAIQSDGKILVAGYFFSAGVGFKMCLLRYNSDGTLDTNFGSNGVDSVSVGSGSSQANGIALQSDGKIVLAGSSSNGNDLDFTTLRFNSDGTSDNTFGSSGTVITSMGNADDYANAVLVQPDGKIVAVGKSGNNPDITVIRYNTDGTLDNSWSSDGKLIINVPGNDNGFAVAMDSGNNIVVCGEAFDGFSYDISVMRYTSAGALDNTFSSDGKTTVAIGNTYEGGYAIAVQGDGKIIVAGKTATSNNGDNVALIRLRTDGTLDNMFGTNGKVSTDFDGSGDAAFGVALQPDAKIVIAGFSSNGTNNDFLVARYISSLNVAVNDPPFDTVSLLVYPNPTSGSMKLSYSLKRDDQVSIRIEDINGRILHSYFHDAYRSAGKHLENMEIPKMISSGNYILRITTEQGSEGIKIAVE